MSKWKKVKLDDIFDKIVIDGTPSKVQTSYCISVIFVKKVISRTS